MKKAETKNDSRNRDENGEERQMVDKKRVESSPRPRWKMRVYRYSKGSTGKQCWGMEPPLQRGRGGMSVDIKRALSHSPLMRGLSTFSKGANERFPCPTQSQAILPVHNVKVEHQLNQLPD